MTTAIAPDESTTLLNDNGFLKPSPSIWKPEFINETSSRLLSDMKGKATHPLYGRYCVRDWHLVYPELINFVSHPTILKQLTSIMGDDLILWRSNIFHKPPGTGPIGWHQDFGTFSGEDIGNNKISLLPSHIPSITEDTLSQYLPSTISLQSIESAPDHTDFWNMTVWVALTEIEPDMGPLRFARGSHKKRFPIRMENLTDSDFWQNPFNEIQSKEQLITQCNSSKLVLDLDTSQLLNDVPVQDLNYDQLKAVILSKLEAVKGSTTVINDLDHSTVETYPIPKGGYTIFSERTLHGSTANTSKKERLGINFRITPSTTLVYPGRLKGDNIDGFNLDISNHTCILLSGKNLNRHNNVKPLTEFIAA